MAQKSPVLILLTGLFETVINSVHSIKKRKILPYPFPAAIGFFS
jgi:uncharacterized membrane protein YvlD (DUF360 family)